MFRIWWSAKLDETVDKTKHWNTRVVLYPRTEWGIQKMYKLTVSHKIYNYSGWYPFTSFFTIWYRHIKNELNWRVRLYYPLEIMNSLLFAFQAVQVNSDDEDDCLQFPKVSEITDASLLLLKRKSNGKYTLFRVNVILFALFNFLLKRLILYHK